MLFSVITYSLSKKKCLFAYVVGIYLMCWAFLDLTMIWAKITKNEFFSSENIFFFSQNIAAWLCYMPISGHKRMASSNRISGEASSGADRIQPSSRKSGWDWWSCPTVGRQTQATWVRPKPTQSVELRAEASVTQPLTRARVNVWIFDEDVDKRAPMFEYFKARKLVNHLTVSEINEESKCLTMPMYLALRLLYFFHAQLSQDQNLSCS